MKDGRASAPALSFARRTSNNSQVFGILYWLKLSSQ